MARTVRTTSRKRSPAAPLRRAQPSRRGARAAIRRRPTEAVSALIALGAIALFAWDPVSHWAWSTITGRIAAPAAAGTVNLRFAKCAAAGQQNCVIDGDTLRFAGETIRIADIDAPETRDYKCAAEKARGDRATQRLLQLVNAGAFAVQTYDRDEDVYGRKLRILARDGESLGEVLVGEGLARRWDGARHPWC